ncbi:MULTISPECIES: ABC transporter permease [Nocardiaceae]|uniref:Phospholipid/cholesterol/gamma-HCH transport system permease protein n=1 Tax=Rhodococcoides corynebacterioides TaxID=53972 RepID=A0ABS2KWG1_9NOCA|nr:MULTISPECIES: ABC transporter permease [Rhodococcus]MBM7416289.1 phospholipid/cholesterol/gamma-HCH transport system permease protein [Rhodococcus corynebacterioides]MBP1114542.1 phospholipid/cholesterol/gamma-HCH transport system permease protein [Rhodococcus sp. PvP016]
MARSMPLVSRVTTGTRTLGRFADLVVAAFGHLVRDLAGLRFAWREFLDQAWFMVTVTVLPAILVSVPFGVIVSVQVGSLTNQIGATSIAGAAGGLGVIRQGAPIVTALLLGGAAGSAIAADLGARTVREEIDAMRVMGIDPVRRLATPRLAAMLVVAPLLCSLVIFMGLVSGYVVNVGFQGGTPGSYLSSFASFASTTDLVVAMVKAEIFGIIVVLVACQRGFEATSGPRGVANAVNASVVVGVLSAFIVNVLATQLVSMFLPQRLG